MELHINEHRIVPYDEQDNSLTYFNESLVIPLKVGSDGLKMFETQKDGHSGREEYAGKITTFNRCKVQNIQYLQDRALVTLKCEELHIQYK